MASHVAHEVRNSLVPVTLYLSLLRRRLAADAASRDIVENIAAGFANLETTVSDLLQFTADRDPCWRRVGLRQLVADVLAALAPQFEAQSIETVLDIPAAHALSADRDMLRRAVLNLCLNSLDAMPDGGRLTITSYCGPEAVELEVADSGPGLSEQARQRAFEPFFTTKSNGTGLGLAIVDRIAEMHRGDVVAANCPEGGAAFTIRIPQRRLEAAA